MGGSNTTDSESNQKHFEAAMKSWSIGLQSSAMSQNKPSRVQQIVYMWNENHEYAYTKTGTSCGIPVKGILYF